MNEPGAPTEQSAPPAPVPVSRLQIAVQVGATALLLWMYGIDFLDAVRFSSAELAAFVHPPSFLFNGAAVLLTLGAAAAAVYGHARKLGGNFRGHRLLPIVAVVVLFADLFIVSSARTPLSASDQAHLAVHEFAGRANSQATSTRVPTAEADLTEMLKDLPPPPYFVRGVRVPAYTLEVRRGCTGPASDRKSAGPGTLLYCVSDDAKEAWVSLVGLPFGRRFGDATVVTRGDLIVTAEVKVGANEAQDDAAPPQPEEQPMPGSRWNDIPGADTWAADQPVQAPPPQDPADAQ